MKLRECWSVVLALSVTQAIASQGQELKDVTYLEAGRTERLDLYLPSRAADGKRAPVLVWIHGGGWIGGDKAQTREKNVAKNLTAVGYAVASISYKLGENAWPQNLLDCKNAVRFVRSNAAKYHLDPDRVAVGGGSAGGHLALMVGLTAGKHFEPPQPYPGISNTVSLILNFYGPPDLFAFDEMDDQGKRTGRKGVPPAKYLPAFGPTTGRERALTQASPITYVDAKSPPILLLHGRTDSLVPYTMSEDFAARLTHVGVPHELVILEGVGHSFNLETGSGKPLPRDVRGIVLAFLAKHFD